MPGPGIELVGAEELAEVIEVMQSGFLSRYGPSDNPAFLAKTHRLEVEMAEYLGTRHALALSGGGSAALLIAMLALGIGAGDEVIVPGFTYVASISSIVYTGATPVLAEIDDTFTLDRVPLSVAVDDQPSPADEPGLHRRFVDDPDAVREHKPRLFDIRMLGQKLGQHRHPEPVCQADRPERLGRGLLHGGMICARTMARIRLANNYSVAGWCESSSGYRNRDLSFHSLLRNVGVVIVTRSGLSSSAG